MAAFTAAVAQTSAPPADESNDGGKSWENSISLLFKHSLYGILVDSFYHLTGLFGGDIKLTPEQQATLEATANPNDPFSPQDAVVRNQRSLWPNGVMPYVIDNSLSSKYFPCC